MGLALSRVASYDAEGARPATVVLRGDLDMADVQILTDVLDRVCSAPPSRLLLDVAALDGGCYAPLVALAPGVATLLESGCAVEIVGPSPVVCHIFHLAGIEHTFGDKPQVMV